MKAGWIAALTAVLVVGCGGDGGKGPPRAKAEVNPEGEAHKEGVVVQKGKAKMETLKPTGVE